MALYRPSNGVSYGVQSHVVTSAEATANAVVFDFQVAYPLAAVFGVVTSANINVPLADAVITYPANGQVRLASGASTFDLVAGQKITVIAQRATSLLG